MTFSPSEVHAYFSSRLPSLRITSAKEWRGPCPIHQGKDPNFAVNAEAGLAQCHSRCGRGWDMISLEQELSGLDFAKAKDRVFEMVGRPKVPWEERNVVAIYDYTDGNGKLLYQVLRYIGKDFKQRRPDGSGSWKWGLGDVERVPYRLEKVKHSEFVAVCEGEKDVLTLERVGMVATCNNGGAGNFRAELVPHFAGKHVAIFPDNDDPGRDHAMKVAAMLVPAVKSLKIVELPGVPAKGDVTDFVNAGGTVSDLRELYRKAQPWSPEWQFCEAVPSENERFIHELSRDVDEAGGLTEFWNLPRLSGIETPWSKLSRALGGGMRDSEVYVLGGNQGSGKTSLVLQFILSIIRRMEGALLFSMEMSSRAVFQRLASIQARVDLNALRDAQYTQRKRTSTPTEKEEAAEYIQRVMPQLALATSELSLLPLIVSMKSSVTPEYIAEETQRLRKRMKIRLVVVDHMQLMSTSGSVRGDYEKFTAISRAMKQTAVDVNVPILLVSQTSRAQVKDHRGELEVSDLRGSGAIEEDAAGVMLIYEDSEDRQAAMAEGCGDRYTKGPVKCFLKLGKNRYGEQGRCFELRHFKAWTRFDIPEDVDTEASHGVTR
jgi:replicative DNA helicase